MNTTESPEVAADAESATQSAQLPVLLGLKEMVDLFPVAEFTVYRWNTIRGGRKQLPPPVVTVSGTPIWTEEQILEFAERKSLKPDKRVLTRIRKSQGH